MSESTTALRADVPGATDKDLATITLAHPLGASDLTRMGIANVEEASVGTQLSIRVDDARSLINAGYAQVDSENPDAVAEALKPAVAAADDATPGQDVTPEDVTPVAGDPAAQTPGEDVAAAPSVEPVTPVEDAGDKPVASAKRRS